MQRPFVLSIAGFDPSAGAGILADIKTFENCGVYGLGLCACQTVQNEGEFLGVKWASFDDIARQLDALTGKYEIQALKIGLVSGLEFIMQVLEYFEKLTSKPLVVWDPIAKASAGFGFHQSFDSSLLGEVLKRMTVVTPNREELPILGVGRTIEAATHTQAALLIKSAEASETACTDILYYHGGKLSLSKPKLPQETKKHGSGCVYSAALTSALALGRDLEAACAFAQDYTWKFLASSKTLLGYHL